MTPADRKATLRHQMRLRLRQVAAPERQAASAQVAALLSGSSVWQTAQAVLLYAPLPDELDLFPLLATALAAGKLVALPAFVTPPGDYRPRRVTHLERDLVPGRYGIWEPQPENEEISLKLLDLAVVPALGFSQAGIRLGRGAGFYDRLLADFAGEIWGVGYAWQAGLNFPAEPHDVRMTTVLTPAGRESIPHR